MFGFDNNEHRRYSNYGHEASPHEVRHAPKTCVSYERKCLIDRYAEVLKEAKDLHAKHHHMDQAQNDDVVMSDR